MGDVDLIWELTEAVRHDTEKPSIEQRFNPVDPVAIEIVLHEADFAVERYMEKWKSLREKFADPSLYDNFVLEFQIKVRKDVKQMIGSAQQFIAEQLEQEQNEEDDEGDYEG
jgi:hypothetical protein